MFRPCYSDAGFDSGGVCVAGLMIGPVVHPRLILLPQQRMNLGSTARPIFLSGSVGSSTA